MAVYTGGYPHNQRFPLMLQLVTLPPAFGMRNVSPFCLKTEMLLVALELPFEMKT